MSAVLFGSISTLADTSELQRDAYNQAFQEHGLGWRWDREEYIGMLDRSGGQSRIGEYADAKDQSVDAAAVHQTKSEIFRRSLAAARLSPREGVVDTIRAAKDDGRKVALVTTTSPENVAALLQALREDLDAADFDLVVDSSSVEQPKPDPAAYSFALHAMGEQADACIAIEDNADGVRAAAAAGVRCVAFPNANTTGHGFADAERVVDRLDPAELGRVAAA